MPKLLMPTDTCTVPSRPKREVLKLSTESHRKWDFFKHGPDCWWYNEPTNDEVAVVFVGEDGAPPVNRDIVVYPRNRLPQRLSYMSCHLDPMCYPIPIHRSNPGWHNGMTHVAEHQISTCKNVTIYSSFIQTGCTIRVQSYTQLGEVVPAICSGCICEDRGMQIVLHAKIIKSWMFFGRLDNDYRGNFIACKRGCAALATHAICGFSDPAHVLCFVVGSFRLPQFQSKEGEPCIWFNPTKRLGTFESR